VLVYERLCVILVLQTSSLKWPLILSRLKNVCLKKTVNILITEDDIGKDQTGLDLIALFEANNPKSRSRVFVLMTGQTTPFLMADFTYRGGDCIINNPFKNDALIKTLTNILHEKDNLSFEDGLVCDIQDAINTNNIPQALEIYASFKNLSSQQSNYSKAIIHYANNDMPLAYEHFVKVLEKKVHFKSLVYAKKIGVSFKKIF
jgi:hypothetical protein